MPLLGCAEEIDRDKFTELLASLMSDRDFWVRELLYQTIDQVPFHLVAAARSQLSAPTDPWKRAAAVRFSAAEAVGSPEIDDLRSDPEGLIRDAADAVLLNHKNQRYLEELIDRFGSPTPAVRASAYFAIADQGGEWSVRRLAERYPEDTVPSQWVRGLASAVDTRRRNEHRKRGREEDRQSEKLDRIKFD
jgi:hypothetical protein